jgi:hypothetical protein
MKKHLFNKKVNIEEWHLLSGEQKSRVEDNIEQTKNSNLDKHEDLIKEPRNRIATSNILSEVIKNI